MSDNSVQVTQPLSAVQPPQTAAPVIVVNYVHAARRHLADATLLSNAGCRPNAGQLLGFSVECGLKAVLIAAGVPKDPSGGIPGRTKGSPDYHKFRQHMPVLVDQIQAFGNLIPDGKTTSRYMAKLASLNAMSSWSVDHRYYREDAIPLDSLEDWQRAALEVNEMLDEAIMDGVI